MDYVAAYMIGNDISSRKLLRDPNYADSPSIGIFQGLWYIRAARALSSLERFG